VVLGGNFAGMSDDSNEATCREVIGWFERNFAAMPNHSCDFEAAGEGAGCKLVSKMHCKYR
jgi:hypothetical protein